MPTQQLSLTYNSRGEIIPDPRPKPQPNSGSTAAQTQTKQ